MGLFNTLDNQANDRNRSHIKNLIEMALADGKIDDKELALLKEVALRFDFTEEDIREIQNSVENVKFTPPSSEKLKIEQLNELVKMMMVDKKIEESEVNLCKSLAIKLNLAPAIIDELIDMNVQQLKRKNSDT